MEDAERRVREVTVDDVKAMLDRGETFHLIDVREESEYAKDHLPGAVHLGKGILERDIEQRDPGHGGAPRALLRRRLSLGAGGGQPPEDGLHQRRVDGRRHPRLARAGVSTSAHVGRHLLQESRVGRIPAQLLHQRFHGLHRLHRHQAAPQQRHLLVDLRRQDALLLARA